VPLSLASPLPSRLEPDGRLRVQVRPGTWALELAARHEGPASALTLPAAESPWAAEEVWVFDPRTDLRLASVEGVPAVDPQQTELPAERRPRAVPDPPRRPVLGGHRAARGPAPARGGQPHRGRRVARSRGRLGP